MINRLAELSTLPRLATTFNLFGLTAQFLEAFVLLLDHLKSNYIPISSL
jgi:hypothetical protein